jgi:hypothetical protein
MILTLGLLALAFATASCRLPCGEPFWKKEGACNSEEPAH